MANLYYSNIFYNDVDRDREAPWRAELQEFRQMLRQEMRQMREMMERMYMGPIRNRRENLAHNDDGIRVKPTCHQRLAPINRAPVYEDLSDDDVSCIQPVSNHIYESPNRKTVHEENVSYSKKVELPLEKQHVQPQPLVPTTIPVEEYPPQARPITITTEINDNGDSFEEDNQVEGDVKKKIFGEIIMEGDENEKSCLGTIYVDFSKYLSPEEPRAIYEDFSKYLSSEESCAIYEDFSKYLSPEEPRVTHRKENSRTSFFQVGVSDVGRNLLIFSMKTKIENMFKIILKQHRLIRSLPIRGQWKYKRKALIVKPRLYVFFFTRTRFASSFISFLTRIGFVLFLFLLE
jgi:hypothetical protein